ncbi:hypothetical protein [Afifella marina]|uniref:DUF2946 domain-containing protein n=1 Tax=Afifella marina DSM 2698 TaxID=1120955 RepID=A0A1G5P7C7_AFIMA|nr:hypothetical protein [Afifella marina]RAI18687.1 hypothetical protein CH311_14510 [Afifella marina DSM 2698]SCZ45443.1 hypothetical protein SAMN03080610_03421 [Afifella marina DSM 2698]
MRFMRHVLGDKFVGGLVAVVVAYMLLFQGVSGAYAIGFMAGGNSTALCNPLASPGQKNEGKSHDNGACPCCSALCHSASLLQPLVPQDGAILLASFGPFLVVARDVRGGTSHPSELRLAAEARAPPILSN